MTDHNDLSTPSRRQFTSYCLGLSLTGLGAVFMSSCRAPAHRRGVRRRTRRRVRRRVVYRTVAGRRILVVPVNIEPQDTLVVEGYGDCEVIEVNKSNVVININGNPEKVEVYYEGYIEEE